MPPDLARYYFNWRVDSKRVKSRVPYMLLAVSIVVLAIGIILITKHFTAQAPPATPIVRVAADRTLVVPGGAGNASDVSFNVTGTGVLKGFVDVASGQRISFYLYPESAGPGSTVAKREGVLRSLFEVPLDTGTYKLVVVSYSSNQGGASGERIVNVYLEFWS